MTVTITLPPDLADDLSAAATMSEHIHSDLCAGTAAHRRIVAEHPDPADVDTACGCGIPGLLRDLALALLVDAGATIDAGSLSTP